MTAKRRKCDLCGNFLALRCTEDRHEGCEAKLALDAEARATAPSKFVTESIQPIKSAGVPEAAARAFKALSEATGGAVTAVGGLAEAVARIPENVRDPKAAGRHRFERKQKNRDASAKPRKKQLTPKERRAKRDSKRIRREIKKRRQALLDPRMIHPFLVEVKRAGPGEKILKRTINARTATQAAQEAADDLGVKAPGMWVDGVEVAFRVSREGAGLLIEGVFEPPPAPPEEEKQETDLILPPGVRGNDKAGVLISPETAKEINAEKRRAMGTRRQALGALVVLAGSMDPNHQRRGACRKLLTQFPKPERSTK